ncbi:MAG: class I SAM-dependent methyltransferase [Clostridia bacterium]|nr:class I SAM-dependent methyltransferase [Clostridia bacterium]
MWNSIHSCYERNEIKYDNWLDLFQETIKNCWSPIIDLGCGCGNDTLYLIEKGKKVIPCDYSKSAIKNIQKNFKGIETAKCFDMSKGLPFEDNFTDLIICDLSLHYFTEKTTFKILGEIKRVLKPNGVLVFRVNSIKDVNHGAGKGKEIEPHLYETSDGMYKRFFDLKDLEEFFESWEKLYINEETMGRYKTEKVLWKGAVRVKK